MDDAVSLVAIDTGGKENLGQESRSSHRVCTSERYWGMFYFRARMHQGKYTPSIEYQLRNIILGQGDGGLWIIAMKTGSQDDYIHPTNCVGLESLPNHIYQVPTANSVSVARVGDCLLNLTRMYYSPGILLLCPAPL